MAFDERWTREALEKYMKSVRPSAPYLPDNIAYIAHNNGLEGGKEEVRRGAGGAGHGMLGALARRGAGARACARKPDLAGPMTRLRAPAPCCARACLLTRLPTRLPSCLATPVWPQVRATLFDTTYLVLGLGDVYLGAPCAVPLDPRQRLVSLGGFRARVRVQCVWGEPAQPSSQPSRNQLPTNRLPTAR